MTRWWDIPAAALIFLLITLAGTRLTITRWTPDLPYVLNLGMLGTLLGFALGKSRFGKRVVTWLAIGYSLVLIPYQLIGELDTQIYLGERLISTGKRLLLSVNEFLSGAPVEDYLLFVAFLCIVYWFVGLMAGYHFVRHGNFLAATLPAGIVMFVIHLYDGLASTRSWLVGFYIFICLLLLGRMYYLFNRALWIKRRIHFSSEIVRDLSAGLLVGAAAIVIFSWNLPQAIPYARLLAERWDRMTEPWDRFLERMNDAVASVKNEGGVGGAGFYDSELELGASNPSSTDIVFTVLVPEESTFAPRFYWRSRVYDLYVDGRWASSPTDNISFSPLTQGFDIPDAEKRTEAEFSFTVFTQNQAMLFLPPQPLWVSRPANSLSIGIADNKQDIFAILAVPPLQRGETYRARAAVADPSIEELRAAGEDYPDWVKERYLQLPNDLSPRLRQLAETLTKDLNTPYDKANAVTAYLRNEIKYSVSIDIPKGVSDPLDYAVFDLKQGFCTYYASAEVLMLRAVGIPARMAVGYAEGELVADDSAETVISKYIVRRRDAHAWPEVYFPGYGWIEFEPTGNQNALIRPETRGSQSPATDSAASPSNPLAGSGILQENTGDITAGQAKTSRSRPGPYLLISLLVISLVAAALYAGRRYSFGRQLPVYISQAYIRNGSQPPRWIEQWARWEELSSIERAFQSVNIALRWLGAPQPVHATPGQRAARLMELLPEAKESIEALEAEHRAQLFTPRPGNSVRARRAGFNILYQSLRKRIRMGLGYN